MRESHTSVLQVGHRLEVTHWPGEPGRIPLVMCSGLGTPVELLAPLAGALDNDRPVIGINPPGMGGSPNARTPYLFHTLACAAGRAVRELGYHRADVLGISWGGAFAQQFAFQNPRRCRRAVLVATHTGWMCVPPSLKTFARMATPRRHRDQSYALRIAGDLYGGTARTDAERAVATLRATSRVPTKRSYLYQLGAISGWTSLPVLPMIRQPTLVLAGDDDPIVRPSNARVMAHLLPRGELYMYSGGHLALLTHAEPLAPVIDEFLDQRVRARPAYRRFSSAAVTSAATAR